MVLFEGAQRIELVVTFYARVTDPRNFTPVLQALDKDEQLVACRRLGWLNVHNPANTELDWSTSSRHAAVS